MNKARRKAIEEIEVQLYSLAERIGEIRVVEQDYIDNMPENLQSSERAKVAEIAVGSLDEAERNLYASMEWNFAARVAGF